MSDYEKHDKVKSLIVDGNLSGAISFCETELSRLPDTPFHWVVGKDMLHLSTDLLTFIANNFKDSRELKKVKAFYSELNGFSINWDRWFLDIVAYDKIGDFQDEESDWLCEGFWGSTNPEYFEITRWETLQTAFKNYHERAQYKDEQLHKVAELAEFLVILRLQQLFEHAIQKGRQQGLEWANVPWGVTAHDYFLIYEIRA